jgi:hypothetical protein
MDNSNTENNGAELTAEEMKTRLTATDCYLNFINHKCLLFLAEEIISALEGENNLTDEQKAYWLNCLKSYGDMSRVSLELVKTEVEFYQREQAINALVPFVSKAHLN